MDLQLTPYVSAGQFKIGALKKNINEVLGSDLNFILTVIAQTLQTTIKNTDYNLIMTMEIFVYQYK